MDRHYDVPEQLLFDILLYLPVLSLLRFKSVCKSWFSLIESSSFIIQHLNHNNGKENNLIVYRQDYKITPPKFARQFLMISGSQYEECANIDFDRCHPNLFMHLVGSCNGIICLDYDGLGTALWNPALKQLRFLPQSSIKHTNLTYYLIAFGIDGNTNDYKVVKIFYFHHKNDGTYSNQVEVYSLRDNSWRIIQKDLILPHSMQTCGTLLPTCGKCFWMTGHKSPPCFLSFDFTDEVFGTLPLLEEHHHLDITGLDIYNGKIALIGRRAVSHHLIDAFCYILEIWTLGKYEAKESWNKLYSQLILNRTFTPTCLSTNGEFLICCDYGKKDEDYLYLYNLHTQEGQFLPYKAHRVIHHTASLISIKGALPVD